MPASYTGLSVFDLDSTLLRDNSSYRFGKFLFEKRALPRFPLCRALAYYLAHRYCFVSLQRLHRTIFSACFKGVPLQYLSDQVQHFLSSYLAGALQEPIVHLLRQAQLQGHYTILLSNSPNFLVAPIAHHLKLHEWASTDYLCNAEGKLEALSTIVDGKAKARHLLQSAQKLGLTKAQIYAYTDSHHDLPLLQCAGKPHAVNPSMKLKQICKQNQWDILSNF